jgi:hypothetical protein
VPVKCSYTSTIPMDRTEFTEPQCLYSTAKPPLSLWTVLPLQSLCVCTENLYCYSTYGPHSLNGASVPVQYICTSTPPIGRTACTELQCLYSTSIPLLPLWAVLSVQSLGACRVQQYFYYSYGPYCLYRASVPILYSNKSYPLWTVRPVQSLSACTVQLYLYSPYGQYGLYTASVPVQYIYNSTPPMGLTACTEPQCLYSTYVPKLPLWAVLSVQSLGVSRVQLYFYYSYGPYCLYRASVPIMYNYNSYPLWTVRPVQSLSACTVQLYF